MNSLIDELVMYCFTNKKNDSFLLITKYIIKNLQNIEAITLKELSEKCYTSTTTINNFCKQFGFQNFYSLKKEIIAHKKIKKQQIINRIENTNPSNLYNAYLAINNINDKIDKDELFTELRRISLLIHQSHRIILYGAIYPLSLLLNFQIDLLVMQKPCYSYTFENIPLKEDLLFIISPTTSFISTNVSNFNSLYLSASKKVFISQSSSLMNTYKNDFDSCICIPGQKDQYENNHNLLIIFDLIKYYYIKDYVI